MTGWLRRIGQGDQDAALQLWRRYAAPLERLARSRYSGALNAVANEEDLVQSVFHALWTGAAEGQWDTVQNRDELWWLLLAITRNKAVKRRTYNARLKRSDVPRSLSGQDTHSHDLSTSQDAQNIAGDSPPPELILMLQEEQERLLASLRDDVLRSIAVWKLDGYTHEEIAGKLNVTPRTVVRKLNLIRETWSEELNS